MMPAHRDTGIKRPRVTSRCPHGEKKFWNSVESRLPHLVRECLTVGQSKRHDVVRQDRIPIRGIVEQEVRCEPPSPKKTEDRNVEEKPALSLRPKTGMIEFALTVRGYAMSVLQF